MPHHVIDVAPLRAEYGELVLGEDSQTTAEDLVTTPDRAVGFGTLTKTETP